MKEQVAFRPALSRAKQVTLVTPMGKVKGAMDVEAGVQPCAAIPPASCTLGEYVTLVMFHMPPLVVWDTELGQTMTGGVVSETTTRTTQEA